MSLFRKKTDKAQTIELSEAHKKPRLILICVLIVIAAVAFATGVMSYLNGDPGWRTIQVSSGQVSCGEDFVFQYHFPASNSAATTLNKKVTALYTEAAEKAYWLFNAEQTHSEMKNVAYLNRHPNETVAVDPVLYDALALLADSGSRHMYLAGVYTEYDNLFFSETDSEAAGRDPARSAEAEDYVSQIVTYANDPAHVSIELLDGNQVRLAVSEEYLAFAQEHEISFVDLHWMKNGFIIDYFAQVLTEAGLTDGYIASVDGFTRNLYGGEEPFSFNIFDRVENGIYLAGRMEYDQPISIVFLRNYPLNDADQWRYYAYADGTVVTSYIDPADGLSKTSTDNLVAYAADAGCAQILAKLLPVYVTGELDEAALRAMSAEQMYSIWCKDTVICYNDPALRLYDLHEGDGLKYTQALVR